MTNGRATCTATRWLSIVGIGEDGKVDRGVLGLVDVLDPVAVRVERIDADGDRLHAALGELALERGGLAQLGGADRGEVRGVREQHDPGVAGPLVEADRTFGGVLDEIGGGVAETQGGHLEPLVG